jgi:hypothetical protein
MKCELRNASGVQHGRRSPFFAKIVQKNSSTYDAALFQFVAFVVSFVV